VRKYPSRKIPGQSPRKQLIPTICPDQRDAVRTASSARIVTVSSFSIFSGSFLNIYRKGITSR